MTKVKLEACKCADCWEPEKSSSEIAAKVALTTQLTMSILHNSFKTTTPLIDATVNDTLPLGDYRSLRAVLPPR